MKLLALDLDGTLLKDDKTISKETVEFLKQYQRDGNIVILISGRNYSEMKSYIELLEINSFIVCNDGINIYDFKGNLIKEFNSLSSKDIYNILNIVNEKMVYKLCYTQNKEFIIANKKSFLDYNFLIYLLKKYIKKCNCELIIFSSLINNNYKFTKMLLWKINPEKYYRSILNRFKNKYQVFWMSLDEKVQIMSIKSNKLNALLYIQKKFEIEDKNVIVFGNDGNDVKMLENYENSFAVSNGSNEAKEVAKFITDSNNKDGVLKGLMNYEKKEVYK